MKKILFLAFVLILLSASMLGMRLVIRVSGSATHHVYPGESIQDAVNSAQAGDMIFVHSGTYHEHVTIDKSITLEGEGSSDTILDGGGGGVVIHVKPDTKGVHISDFTIKNGEKGVFVEKSENNILRNNNITGNIHNFGVTGWKDAHFTHDIDTSNTVDGKPIYYWVGKEGKKIPLDAGYVAVVNSRDITVKDLTLTNNVQGILFRKTREATITNVKIMRVAEMGIWLDESFNNKVCDNEVSNVHDGIYLSGYGITHSNIISGNMVSNCSEWGLYLINSVDNTFYGNTITMCSTGINLENAEHNTFHHNNLINNAKQVSFYWVHQPLENTWDDGTEGNYWSDYTGEDQNGDGIGEVPCVIAENNQDNHPLMSPWSPPPAEEEEGEVPFWTQWWLWTIVAVGIAVLAGVVYFLKKRKPPTLIH